MSWSARQTALLLRNAIRMDFRVRAPAREGGRIRNLRPLTFTLLTDVVVGLLFGLELRRADVPLFLQALVVYLGTGLFVVLHLMIEYQEILSGASDADILGWRPIDSRTLYVSRVLHVGLYVALIGLALILPASLSLGLGRPAAGGLVAAAVFAGGMLHVAFAAGCVVLLHGVLLRRLPAERFQDVLGAVQVGATLVFAFGYQLLTPEVLESSLRPESTRWTHALPAAWFAVLPAAAVGATPAWGGIAFAAGTLAVLGIAAVGVQRLGPDYQMDVEAARIARGFVPARRPVLRDAWLRRAAHTLLGSRPLRQLGFDTFLAHLRGDRRLRTSLLPIVTMPLALVLAAIVMTHAQDPYRLEVGRETSSSEATSTRGVLLYSMAAYMVVLSLTGSAREMSRSPDWRAAWVVFAAPVRRYDDLSLGSLWGMVYGLFLPSIVLLTCVLLAAWRDPLHVAAHLALPAGLAMLAMPIAFAFDPSPPFSREPLRGARGREFALSMVMLVPLLVFGGVQAALRGRPWILVFAGVGSMLVACGVWWLVARRLRTSFPHMHFEAS